MTDATIEPEPVAPDDQVGTAGRAADALRAAGMGVWDWNVVTGELIWDEQIARLHGFDPAEFDGTLSAFLSRIHPEDQPDVAAGIQEALGRGGAFHTEFRVQRPDGTTAWIQGRGRAVLNADGLPVRMIGVGADTTELRTTREQLGRTLAHISDGVVLLDRSWTIAFANSRAARILQRSVDDLVGQSVRDVFPDVIGTEFSSGIRAAIRTQETYIFEAYYGPLDGWFEVRVHPSPSGLTVYFQDVNERRERAAAQEKLVVELETALRRQADLQSLVAALAESLTIQEVAAAVLDQTHRTLGTDYAGVALMNDDKQALRFVTLEGLPAETVEQWGEVPMRVSSALTDAVRFRRALYHANRAELLDAYPHLQRTVEVAGSHAWVSIPMVSGRQVVGALSMSWDIERTFTPEDRAFISTLAAQCAQAVERAQLFARQADVADTLQRAMLPEDLPLVEGLDISACYLSAKTDLSIGGDWYDAFMLEDGRLALAVGDVSGHGLTAATVMGRLRNGLRAYLIEEHSPAATLTKLDAMVELEGRGLFATAVVAVYDPRSGELVWSNAGHPPPLLLAGEGARYLEGHVGAPVGVGGPDGHRDERIVVRSGEVLIAFTDGLIERRREHLDEGFARLRAAVTDGSFDIVAEGCEALVHRVTDGGDRADDVCVLMLHRRRAVAAGTR
ncbi:MAG TPA: SpoIIE family protein phosphatase [Acidimicrobiales bacterium]